MRLNRKRKTKDPCDGCGLHKALCICGLTPRLDLSTRVTLLIHAKELKRTTNTGRLAVRALVNSEMRVRGLGREPVDLSDVIKPEYRNFVYFPSEKAIELTERLIAEDPRPIHLIVPDGNWRQASKVPGRHPELAPLTHVKISQANEAKQHLRLETSASGMATLEAIAHALKVIEGPQVFAQLYAFYTAKLERTLAARPPRGRASSTRSNSTTTRC